MISHEVGCYLVEMLILNEKTGEITAKKLSDRLGVSCAAVTQMVRKLDEYDLVRYESYGRIRLTGKGRASAKKLLSKRRLMHAFLLMLGVSRGARTEAEFLSAYMSDRVFDSLNEFMRKSAKGEKTPGSIFPLNTAPPGDRLAVIAVATRLNTAKKLANAGIMPGVELSVKETRRSSIIVSKNSSEMEISKKNAKYIFVILL